MGRITIALLFCAMLSARDARLPAGHAADGSVTFDAVLLDAATLQQETGSDFGGQFIAIEVTLTPKNGKSIEARLDNFLMRDSNNGDHTGPLLPSQVLGKGGLVLQQGEKSVVGIDSVQRDVTGIAKSKSTAASPETLNALKQKMLPEATVTSPVKGLLFFSLDKPKTKNLDLVYASPEGKLHVSFR